MSKESDAVRREIAALEAELDKREKPTRQARSKVSGDNILSALQGLEDLVKNACGESFMDDDVDVEMDDETMYMDDEESEMSYMDDEESEMSYMDDDESESMMDDDLYVEDDEDEMFMDDDFDDEDDFDDLDDDFVDEPVVLEEDLVYASETRPGIEDEINQDSLDDVLEERKDPASIVTDMSMLDAAPTNYVARLKSASARLDKVAAYLEQQGKKKLAFRIDKIADAIDARIKQEVRNA